MVVSRLPPLPAMSSTSRVTLFVRSTVVVTLAPPSRRKVPLLFASAASALLLFGAEASATRALAPSRKSDQPS